MLERTPDGPATFVLNYREILGSCRFRQLAFGVDVLEVQTDVIGNGLEQFGHQAVRQPQRLGLDEDADMHFFVIASVKKEWRFRTGTDRDGLLHHWCFFLCHDLTTSKNLHWVTSLGPTRCAKLQGETGPARLSLMPDVPRDEVR